MSADDSKGIRSRFVADARIIYNELLAGLPNSEFDEIFRHVHSIKSIAAQVGENDIAHEADEVESFLETSRGRPVDTNIKKHVSWWLSDLDSTLTRFEREFDPSEEGKNTATLNQFERQLLDEARRRGERYYRLSCRIDPQSPLKLARAHLVLSNLEQNANVIACDPPLNNEDEDRFEQFAVYLTADADEQMLYEAANVDEVDQIRLDLLTGSDDYTATTALEGTDQDRRDRVDLHGSYRIESRTLQWSLAQLNEADMVIRKSRKSPASLRLLSILGALRNSLMSVQRQRLGDLFQRLATTAEEIAASMEKRIHVETAGEDLLLDSRLVDSVSDGLLHLVRNAVDHGIELPADRKRDGKPVVGTITVAFRLDSGVLEFSVRDDGKGIENRNIEEQARARGFPVEPDDDLISLLSIPGFSTLDTPTSVSGRGYGIDIVVQRATAVGGTVDIESEPGSGTIVFLRFPPMSDSDARLVIRNRSTYYAIPSASIERIVPLDIEALKRDRNGGIYRDRVPLYNVGGRLRVEEGVPRDGTMILIRYLDRTGWLCVDDVLFERSTVESSGSDPIELIDPSIIVSS